MTIHKIDGDMLLHIEELEEICAGQQDEIDRLVLENQELKDLFEQVGAVFHIEEEDEGDEV